MLSIENASFAYGSARVLHEVSLSCAPGRTCLLIGPNGSGKSSLLRLAAGLRSPESGGVTWCGLSVCDQAPHERARSVAWVAQRSMMAIDVTVRELVELGAVHGAAACPLEAVLEELALGPLAHRSFHALSGGQQQRCIMARALRQHGPGGLLLLDEPLANLDPAEVVRVVAALRRRAAEGAVILAAMHDIAVAGQWADDVALLCGGRLLACGTAADVLRSDLLGKAFGCEFQTWGRAISFQLPGCPVESRAP